MTEHSNLSLNLVDAALLPDRAVCVAVAPEPAASRDLRTAFTVWLVGVMILALLISVLRPGLAGAGASTLDAPPAATASHRDRVRAFNML